jgi:hypothetical protein
MNLSAESTDIFEAMTMDAQIRFLKGKVSVFMDRIDELESQLDSRKKEEVA